MNEHSQYDHYTITYIDRHGNDRMMLFFDSGRVTQVRVYLDLEEENVKYCFIAYSNTHFVKNRIEFMEKEFYRDGVLINEYYTDGVMDYYNEKKCTQSFDILRGFSNSGILLNIDVIYKDHEGKPYASYEQLDDAPSFYRRINSKGAYSRESFKTFADCIKFRERSFDDLTT